MRKAKIVLVGSAHTGKTSLVNRFVYGEFSPHTMPSTQPAFFQKKVNYLGTEFTLEIWDTAGQEQYHALSPMYYRDADAGIVVFDLTDMSSFAKSKQWVSELRQNRGDSITIALAGNKSDLQSIRTVKLDSIQQFAKQINAESFETSAKTGENVQLLFNSLVKTLSSKTPTPQTQNMVGQKRSSVRFEDRLEEQKSCC